MPTNLYRYLPTFVRMRDRLASGLTDEDTEEAVLEKIVACLAEIFDETDEFIQDLVKLTDADQCDPTYFMHLSYVLGTLFPTGGNEAMVRHLIKNVVSFYKTKGTHHSWGKAWAWLGVERPGVVELYKTTPQETINYSAYESVTHPLRAARIDLTTCQSYCQSYCEAACEAYCEEDVEIGTRLTREEALQRLAYVEDYRPIQVLLRLDAEDVQLASQVPQVSDSIGHYPPEYEPAVWRGSEVQGDFTDDLVPVQDMLEIDVECVSTCEASCQGCCEVQCECDACETLCQVGSCEQSCTTGCQFHCEFPCEHSCQFACTACQASCTTGDTVNTCSQDCETSCVFGCTVFSAVYCTACCQTSCTSTTCMTQCQCTGATVA